MARVKPVSGLSIWVEAWLERMVVRHADAVVCVTEEHAALLRRAHPDVPPGKIVTIPNGFDGAEWEVLGDEDSGAGAPGEERSFVITYTGSIYNQRSPEPVFRAVKALIDADEVAPGRIRIDLVGQCDVAMGRPVGEMAAHYGLAAHVRLTGPLDRLETLRRLARSDLLVLLAEGLILQIPGKTYEYLQANRPILALASGGAVERLLRTTGGAWVVDPDDATGISAAIRRAYQCWTEGRRPPVPARAIVATFDRRVLAGRFAELFDRVSDGLGLRATGDEVAPIENRLPSGPPDAARAAVDITAPHLVVVSRNNASTG